MGCVRQRPDGREGKFARYVAGQQVAVARDANPVEVLTRSDTRPWRDLDANGLPFDANGNIQFNELSPSAATPTFGRNVSTLRYDPEVLERLGQARLQHGMDGRACSMQLMDRVSVNGGYYRRQFGNQTFTDDLRFDQSSYDVVLHQCAGRPAPAHGGGRVIRSAACTT